MADETTEKTMGSNESRGGRGGLGRLPYVKPMLDTHGSVQKLTEGGHTPPHVPDSGSNIKFQPGPITEKLFGDW